MRLFCGLLFIYFFKKKGTNNLAVETTVNLADLKQFYEAVLDMGFPTKTRYDEGIKYYLKVIKNVLSITQLGKEIDLQEKTTTYL